jgi:anti-sigma factor RsiW
MTRKRLRVVETSVLAHRSSDTLYAYSDGSLPDSQRPEVDAHLRICAACRQSMQEIHRLDLLLQDFPPAPAVPFPRFWSKLEGRLPNRQKAGIGFFRPRQLAAGFALAVVASLVGVVALASDQTMPDSPLYSVKHVRQDVQLSLTSGRQARPRQAARPRGGRHAEAQTR